MFRDITNSKRVGTLLKFGHGGLAMIVPLITLRRTSTREKKVSHTTRYMHP